MRLRKVKPIPLIEPGKTKLTHDGASSDGRTNQWIVTCPNCGQQGRPKTTMFNEGTYNCRSCARLLVINYRAEIETVTLRSGV